jgi:ferric-dicitrate binding protein FerR (iron transport regulator)
MNLLAKQMGQYASEQEIKELNELFKKHPHLQYFAEIVRSIEGEKQHYEPAAADRQIIQEGWMRLENTLASGGAERLPEMPPPRKDRTWMLRAAVWLAVIVTGTAVFYRSSRPQKPAPEEVAVKTRSLEVPYGAPERKVLPDSTVVWLNAGSHISFSDEFLRDKREIFLEGEACFDVKSDPEHPFVVHAGNVVIHVLGTKFNIKAYDDENKIETTLINGKLQVQIADNPDKKIVLSPNEKLTVINRKFNVEGGDAGKQKELSFQVKGVEPLQTETPIPEIAWMQDKLAFQNEQFGELARGLERRYNVHIVFKDASLTKERLNGVLENENIGKAMQLLEMTTPFRFKIIKDSVFLYQ